MPEHNSYGIKIMSLDNKPLQLSKIQILEHIENLLEMHHHTNDIYCEDLSLNKQYEVLFAQGDNYELDYKFLEKISKNLPKNAVIKTYESEDGDEAGCIPRYIYQGISKSPKLQTIQDLFK